MKKIALALLAVLLVLSIGYCQEQPIKFTIKAVFDEPYDVGRPGIIIAAIFKNVSDKPIVLARDYDRYDFKFFDADDKPLPSEKPRYPSYMPIAPIKLLPGQEWSDELPADDWKIEGSSITSKPRKIFIKGIYEGPSNDEKFEGVDIFKGNLVSNAIPIEIVPVLPAINKELNKAVQNSDIKKINDLISKGADVNVGDWRGKQMKPLHYATEPDIGLTTFYAKGGAVLRSGKSVPFGENIAFDRSEGLSYSKDVENAKLKIIKLLISNGADVNAKDATGMTPLMNSAVFGGLDIAKFLIANGADVNAKSVDGSTALTGAVSFGNIEIAKLLISNGADVNARSINDMTALMGAAYCGYTEIAKLLISNGADLNVTSDIGETALSIALSKGRNDMVALLKKAEAKMPDEKAIHARDFSADLEITIAGRTFGGRKIYVSNYKTRIERGGEIIITDTIMLYTWTVMPAEHAYTGWPTDIETILDIQPQAVVGMKKMPGELEKTLIGQDIIDGKTVNSYLITYASRKGNKTMLQWIDPKTSIPVKMAGENGAWAQEYKNIVVSPQPDSLFEIPSGYKKIEPPQVSSFTTVYPGAKLKLKQ